LMFTLHKSQRYTLASLAFALVCIAINAAHGEVASVYGGSDGLCGRTANGEHVNCSAMTAAHRTLPFGTQSVITAASLSGSTIADHLCRVDILI
jgi:rare lipoprotein A (peptidoglycan hydrolase)